MDQFRPRDDNNPVREIQQGVRDIKVSGGPFCERLGNLAHCPDPRGPVFAFRFFYRGPWRKGSGSSVR